MPPAFKGRPRRTRRTHQPILIAENDFGVGADIDIEGQFLGPIHAGTHHTGDDVTTHIA